MAPPVFIDLETRSACDLRKEGSIPYAAHPTTQILTAAWTEDYGETYHLWLPGAVDGIPDAQIKTQKLEGVEIYTDASVPDELLALATRPWMGHNTWGFDRVVWAALMPPEAQPIKWHDTMPMAASVGLPQGLDAIGKRLSGEDDGGKDKVGKSMLKKHSRCKGPHYPEDKNGRKSDKLVDDTSIMNVPVVAQMMIGKYNIKDVQITVELAKLLEREVNLNASERRVLMAHDSCNQRGVRIDRDFVRALEDLSVTSAAHAFTRIAEITKDDKNKLTDKTLNSRPTVLAWLEEKGVNLGKSLAKGIIAKFIDNNTDTGDTWTDDDEADLEDGDTYDRDADTKESLNTNLPTVISVLTLRMSALRVTSGKIAAARARCGKDGRIRHWSSYWAAHCASGDTEVLTRDGWVRLDKWQGGEIAQWSPDGSIEFLPATANEFFTDEGTVTHEGPYTSGVFTLGHKVPTLGWNDKLVIKQAGELLEAPRTVLPLSGVWKGSGGLGPDQIRLLVAVQADGSWTEQEGVRFSFKKVRKIERLRALLTSLGVKHTEKTSTVRPDVTHFRIRREDVPVWLTRERKVFGPWLLDTTEEARRAFLAELEHWDGDRTAWNVRYSSKIPANHEWVVTLAHLCGKSASTREDKGAARTVIREYNKTRTQSKHWTASPPIPAVYCPTTRTGFWLYRHNGNIAVTHNTGRWAGRGIQPHNLPRPKEGVDTWDLCSLYEETKSLSYDAVYARMPISALNAEGKPLYPRLSVDDAASGLLRSIFIPDDGDVFMAADLANIEARVLAWLAGETWLMKAFWSGEDPYMKMAEKIFGGKSLWKQYPDPQKAGCFLPLKKHPFRQVGKVVSLGSGYQLGADQFSVYAAANRIDLAAVGATAPECIYSYRRMHPAIAGVEAGEFEGRPYFKGGLWDQLNAAAISACNGTPSSVGGGKVHFEREGPHLVVTLPSGRRLVYRDADIRQKDYFGKMKDTVTYLSPRFGRKALYGGSLAENIVQAISRDVLAYGFVLCEEDDLPIVLHVHDELCSSAPEKRFPDFMSHVTTCPAWLTDFPLMAEGSCAPRYAKAAPPGVKETVYQNGEVKVS